MTTEVKQSSFGELLEKSYRKTGNLFDIKLQMEEVSFGGKFFCYACKQVFPLSKRMTIRHREYCPDCYATVKREPLTKDRGEDN